MIYLIVTQLIEFMQENGNLMGMSFVVAGLDEQEVRKQAHRAYADFQNTDLRLTIDYSPQIVIGVHRNVQASDPIR